MIDDILQIIAPHHCYGCGKIGTLLCDNCKYDITSEPFSLCFACSSQLAGTSGICSQCHVNYERAWCVGPRHDSLEKLIDAYKFANVRSGYRPLSQLIDSTLPSLPDDTRIVPIPTVSAHIRQRGYDHTLLIAKYLAKKRGLRLFTGLQRATSTKQRDSGRRQRTEQAKRAFVCNKQLDENGVYLLIDDVVTTGATMKFAAKTLQNAGAGAVWAASISRQTLD